MSTTWRQAPTVSSGEVITSSQLNKLAEAWNDRIKSGIGDCAWRIMWYAHSLFRQVRLDDGSDLVQRDEWWKFYCHIPSETNVEWPDAPVNTGGGANPANPMMRFVYGTSGIQSEDNRINIPLNYQEAGDAEVIWQHGKQQRGYINPVDGTLFDARAWNAARAHFYIPPNHVGKYLVTYGSYQPVPPSAGHCGDALLTPKWTFAFTPTAAGSLAGKTTQTYTGFCPSGSTGASDPNAIRGIFKAPEAWYIVRWDGNVDVLEYEHYTNGPYTRAGVLGHGEHGGFDQIINKYVLEFRGSDDQREASGYDVEDAAFPFHRFFTTQYTLAPNNVLSPLFKFRGTVAINDASDHSPYELRAPFVWSGYRVKVTGLTSGTVAIRATRNDVEVGTTSQTSDGSVIVMFNDAYEPGEIQFKATDNWTAAEVEVDALELYKYKPGIADAYVCLRHFSAIDSYGYQWERDGRDYESSAEAGAAYFETSAVVNAGSPGVPPQVHPSQNAIYEAARRLVHDNCRMVAPDDLVGYEVDGQGRSVLYFKRFAFGSSDTNPLPQFEGMESAIADTAPVGGYSNEWVCFPSFAHYHTSGTSQWEREAYEKLYGFLTEPGLVYSDDIKNDAELSRHIAPGQNPVLTPEAPSGYRYTKGINGSFTGTWTSGQQADHFRASPVYKTPYYIVSVRPSDTDEIAVTLNTRLFRTSSAPSSVSRDVSTWNKTNLQNEPHASDENRIMKWLFHRHDGSNFNTVVGDGAADGLRDLEGLTDNPFSAIVPRWYFVKLIPKVYEDGNASPDSADTLFQVDPFIQMDFYGRPMVEGFIDGVSTVGVVDNDCTLGGGMYDYTFEAAMNQVAGANWNLFLPLSVREDGPRGFTPIPNTTAYASIFNQYAGLINLMTRARLDLPVTLERQSLSYDARTPISPDYGTTLGTYSAGSPPETVAWSTIGGSGDWMVWGGVVPGDDSNAVASGWSSWSHSSNLVADKSGRADSTFAWGLVDAEPHQYGLYFTGVDWQWRMPSQNAINSLTSELTGLFDADQFGIFGNFSTLETVRRIDVGSSTPDTVTCSAVPWPGDPIDIETTTTTSDRCGFLTGSTVASSALPHSEVALQVEGVSTVCQFGGADTGLTFSLGSTKIGSGNLYVEVPTTAQ